MKNFTYYTPTKVIFGQDTVSKLGQLAKESGAKKVLLHYGSERVKKSGLLPNIEEQLDARASHM